jgi:hypothetical protein
MDTLPEVKCLEFVRSTDRIADADDPNPDVTWFLVYTGTLFFCKGGAGVHTTLFHDVYEKIPQPAPPREGFSKTSSIVAAGRIKEIKGARLHLWGSKNLGVATPQDWWPVLKKILDEQAVPQVLATL